MCTTERVKQNLSRLTQTSCAATHSHTCTHTHSRTHTHWLLLLRPTQMWQAPHHTISLSPKIVFSSVNLAGPVCHANVALACLPLLPWQIRKCVRVCVQECDLVLVSVCCQKCFFFFWIFHTIINSNINLMKQRWLCVLEIVVKNIPKVFSSLFSFIIPYDRKQLRIQGSQQLLQFIFILFTSVSHSASHKF